MKNLKNIGAFTLLTLFLFSATSCFVSVPAKHHDNGKHKGWYKKSNKSHQSLPENKNHGKKKGKHKDH